MNSVPIRDSVDICESAAPLPQITDMKLPLTPQDITAGWLTDALTSRYPGVQVTSAAVIDVIRGTSTKIRVGLQYNRAGVDAGLPHRHGGARHGGGGLMTTHAAAALRNEP